MDVTTQIPAASDLSRDLRFSHLFEAAAIGISICDFKGRVLEANPTLSGLFDLDTKEMVGWDPWEFQSAGVEARRLLPELLRGQRASFAIDKLFRRKDGSDFWGHLTVSLARDAGGQPAFLVVLLEDATERKRAAEQLRQTEKMEVIGRLAGGIAHDFNNLLTGILLYCDLMLGELEPASHLRHHVEEVRMAGEQGAALTHQLLALARKDASEPQPLELNEIVSSTENLLRRLIGEQVELLISLDPSAGSVFADPGRLRQVLLNLVLNARDALSSRSPDRNGKIQNGKIRVSTRLVQFPPNHAPGSAQPSVALTVDDNGCGMNTETRAHLFEPFFTTKKAGEGTGMGLANVQQIVSASGGTIEVTSQPGFGTRIEVFLPAEATKPAAPTVLDRHHHESGVLKGEPSC